MFWFIFTLLSLLFAYLGSENNTLIKNKSIQVLFQILLIITISYPIAFGGENYIDHEGYINHYNNINYYSISFENIGLNISSERDQGIELGFLLLNKLCYWLGFADIGFLFVIALITNTLFIKFLYRFEHPVFNILVFITSGPYWQECNLIRQMIACAIICYSLKFLLDKKIVKYIIGVICAALIHTSAMLLLVFVIFAYIDVKKYYKKINIGLLLLWFLSILVSLGVLSFNLSEIDLFNFYDMYFTNENKVGNQVGIYALYYNLCLILFFILFDKSKFERYYIYIIFFILGGVFTNFSVTIPNFYRISLYFSITNVLMLSTFLKSVAKTKFYQVSNVVLVVLAIYFSNLVAVKIITNSNPITNSLTEIFK